MERIRKNICPDLHGRARNFHLKKSAAIISGFHIHHLDHLLPLAEIIDIPVIVTDQDLFEIGKKCYPHVDLNYIPHAQFSPQHLATHFDALFTSAKYWRLELGGLIELLTGKKLDFLYCPHGNSDKGNYDVTLDPFRCQENAIIYGDQMLNRLESWDVKLQKVCAIGNYRLSYYLENKNRLDSLVKDELLIPKRKKTLFYAPSWDNSSLFHIEKQAICTIPNDIHLIVKLHPYLKEKHPSTYSHFKSLCDDNEQITFIDNLPTIYPILDLCDGYIGDTSSIGYDFLFYDRPLFFIGDQSEATPLFDTGIMVDGSLWESIDKHWDQSFLSKKRKELYTYAFGKMLPLDVIAKKVVNELLT
ncbi:MAG: CDP-glycerol glycerophosphotransferase family protein [Simkaniaceae bacterium]|nr:CDP-glycerol glycerophosphotransferase family protein [Simkaniaceae bacterium]